MSLPVGEHHFKEFLLKHKNEWRMDGEKVEIDDTHFISGMKSYVLFTDEKIPLNPSTMTVSKVTQEISRRDGYQT